MKEFETREKHKGYTIKISENDDFFTYTIFNKDGIIIEESTGFGNVEIAMAEAKFLIDEIISEGLL